MVTDPVEDYLTLIRRTTIEFNSVAADLPIQARDHIEFQFSANGGPALKLFDWTSDGLSQAWKDILGEVTTERDRNVRWSSREQTKFGFNSITIFRMPN